ncbi:hypothetical protein IAR55_001231 [Kwoniella newhampshirensis]|uniref:Protein CPL1-like domain-containing protein n=1 Tax=Kwoniella newhampshirensis TaxID=1651941 RepID=A0AAW0Z4Z8_9TREE
MYFAHLWILTLVCLSTPILAMPTPTIADHDALAIRYHIDHRRHHPRSGPSSRPSASASASARKRAIIPTPVVPQLPLGAPADPARCPSGMMACPITSMTNAPLLSAGSHIPFECVSPEEDLYSCGGCATLGTGTDCTAISGVSSVSCSAGICNVHSCQAGLFPTSDLRACTSDLGSA